MLFLGYKLEIKYILQMICRWFLQFANCPNLQKGRNIYIFKSFYNKIFMKAVVLSRVKPELKQHNHHHQQQQAGKVWTKFSNNASDNMFESSSYKSVNNHMNNSYTSVAIMQQDMGSRRKRKSIVSLYMISLI